MKRYQWILAAAGVIGILGTAETAESQQQNSGAAGAAGQQQSGTQQQTPTGQTPQQGLEQGQGQGPTVGVQGRSNVQFGGFNQTPWFADAGAQQQLNLTPQQRTQLQNLYRNQYNQFQQRLRQMNSQAGLTAQQRMQQQRQLQQQFNRNFNQSLDQEFGNAPFRERFNQLGLQHQGLNAFANENVQQQLNINPSQQQRIDQLAQEMNGRFRDLYEAARDNPDVLREDYRDLLQSQRRQLEDILNQDQLAQWDQMIGETFAFPPSAHFPTDNPGTPSQSQTDPSNEPLRQRVNPTNP